MQNKHSAMESIAETILQICAAKSMALNPEEYPESRPAETARSSYRQMADGILKRVLTIKIKKDIPYIFRYKKYFQPKNKAEKLKEIGRPDRLIRKKLDRK